MAFYLEKVPVEEIEILKDPKFSLKFGRHSKTPKPFINAEKIAINFMPSWFINDAKTTKILCYGGGGWHEGPTPMLEGFVIIHDQQILGFSMEPLVNKTPKNDYLCWQIYEMTLIENIENIEVAKQLLVSVLQALGRFSNRVGQMCEPIQVKAEFMGNLA